MLVFWKERLVYLATPKTGSTAIESALEPLASMVVQRPPELKHTTVQRYRRFLQPFLERAAQEDFTVVAVMREPVDWLGSWYRYRQRDGIRRPERRTNGISFDAFVEAHLSDAPPEYAKVGRQTEFLVPSDIGGVDRLFRYERIDSLVQFLEERLDCEITLPRLNVSPPGSIALDDRTHSMLRTALQDDFSLYASLD